MWYIIITLLALLFVICPQSLANDGFTYGSKVMANDLDESRSLCALDPPLAFGYWDVGLTGFDPGDPVYIDFDANGCVDEYDLRLTPFGEIPAGTQVSKVDNDCGKLLSSFVCLAVPAYFDVNGDGAYSLEDPGYLDAYPSGRINANDVRITSYQGYPAGSRVRDSDTDNGMPTSILPGVLSFYNYNGNIDPSGNAIYDGGDIVYIDTQAPWETVTINDVRMSV